MKKFILPVLLCIGIMSLLLGCKSQPAVESSKAAETTAHASSETQTQNKENISSMKIMYSEHLEDTLNWPGKSLEELKLNLDPKEKYPNCEGKLFGAKTTGSLFLKTTGEKRIVESISLYAEDSSIQDFYEKMLELYGGPVEQGMEPYVKSNGGAQIWYVFDGGDYLVRIAQGSENSFVEIHTKMNPEPKQIGKLVLRAAADTDIMTLELSMSMKAVSYEDGILTVAITNQTGEDTSYSDDFILAKQTEDGSGYTHMHPMGEINTPPSEPNTYSIADAETKELNCDLRKFGKVYPDKYMLILDDMRAEFELLEEGDPRVDSPADPWFCSECGKKNEDVKFCTECGAKREAD